MNVCVSVIQQLFPVYYIYDLRNFIRSFGWACKRGGGGGWGAFIREIMMVLKNFRNELMKNNLEKHQHSIKNYSHRNYNCSCNRSISSARDILYEISFREQGNCSVFKEKMSTDFLALLQKC